MSVPTAQFEGLHLTGGMPPHTRSMSSASASTTRGVRERAIIIRDVFASLTPDCLPSEYRKDIFNDIIRRPNQPNDATTHMRPGDLAGSLFKWSAYNTKLFDLHVQLQPFDNLSKQYYEVMLGRFERLFAEYDGLPQIAATDLPLPEHSDIVALLRRYYEDAKVDLQQRHARADAEGEPILPTYQRFASLFITQIRRLCERSTVRPTQRPRRGPGPTQPPRDQTSYLFQEMLGSASDRLGLYFGLEVLEACSKNSLEKFQPRQDNLPGLRELRDLLAQDGASPTYQTRFAALVTEDPEE